MRISTKGRYALLIMITIAKEKKLSISELAKQTGLSLKYLEQITSNLVKNNLLNSFRGSNGGYMLQSEPKQITLNQIFNASEGDIKTVDCISEETSCPKQNDCLTIGVWIRLNDIIDNYLNSVTLQDVLDKKV